MKLLNELILLTESFDIGPKDIKIKNGIMLPNQFPNKVNNFNCYNLKKLTSLENCPQEVENGFECSHTSITSLEYAPQKIKQFKCANTKITSLEHAPLNCTLFICSGNDIKSLPGIGRKYLKECEYLGLPDTIKSNILGLCRIEKLKNCYILNKTYDRITSEKLYDALEIVKKHLDTSGEECAEELRQNGFKDYAKF